MSIYLGTTKISGAYTIAKNIGEVFYSQSSSAADNPGGLPLFTGETISNADQLYPQFYNWVLNHSELCTTNSEYETSITNWGLCSYYVINDTTKTIKLPKLSSNNRYLIDSYSSGATWYNIYSDGWCEQGNFLTNVTGTQTINLFKEYLDTNYNIQMSESYTTTLADARSINNANKNTDSFQIFVGSASTVGIYWRTSGYVDVSDYKKKEIYPWVFAYNTAISASMAQAAEFQTALTSKADVDLANCTKPYVTETYSNGTSWYRVWSDGWCEQGGRTGVVGDAQGTNVTFLKEFGDTNYMVCITLQTTNDDYNPGENNIAKLLTTGFSVWCQEVGGSVYFHWKAEGYLPSES